MHSYFCIDVNGETFCLYNSVITQQGQTAKGKPTKISRFNPLKLICRPVANMIGNNYKVISQSYSVLKALNLFT